MSRTKYTVIPGADNPFIINLAKDLSGVTRITLDLDGTVVDSATSPTAIVWAEPATEGDITFALGAETIAAGEYEAILTTYDPDHTDGYQEGAYFIDVAQEITLIATPGAADANTYCTFAEAKAVLAKKLYHTHWDEASDYDKKIALVMATKLLDALVDWDGSVYSYAQALRFPRYSVYTPDGVLLDYNLIPDFLKEATAVFADALLGEDLTLDAATKGFDSLRVGPIAINVNRLDRKNIIPKSVWIICQHYGKIVGYKARQRTLQRC